MIKRTHRLPDDDAFEVTVRQAYECGAEHYARWWRAPHQDQTEAWERFRAAVKPGGTVLDVGCNAGTDLRRIVDAGFAATGIDVSERALALCRERCPEARTVAMNMLDLRDLGERFDGIWLAYSLLHIPFRRVHEALSALAAALQPDGVLMVTMSVVEESVEHLHESNVMFDAAGRAREVPAAHWEPDALVEALGPHFEIGWRRRGPWVEGWAPFSLLARLRGADPR